MPWTNTVTGAHFLLKLICFKIFHFRFFFSWGQAEAGRIQVSFCQSNAHAFSAASIGMSSFQIEISLLYIFYYWLLTK